MSDAIKFATADDQRAFNLDLAVFGNAMVDQHGKHVPLDTVLIHGAQIDVSVKRLD